MRNRISSKIFPSTSLHAQQSQRMKGEQPQHFSTLPPERQTQQRQTSQPGQAASLQGQVTTARSIPGEKEPGGQSGHSLSRISILRPDVPAQSTELPSLAGTPGNSVVQRTHVSSSPPAPQPTSAPASTIIRRVARQASQLPASPLPHAARIQRSFGRYSLHQIQAHQGSEATTSAKTIEAQAFTSGNHVVFAGTPSLQIAAHEAAHVIQQQNGIHLPGSIDTPGDRYERNAEAVAQRVVAGQSAEALLDQGIGTVHMSAAKPAPHALTSRNPPVVQTCGTCWIG